MALQRKSIKAAVVGVVLTPLLAAAALGLEVVLAINAPRLPDQDPYDLDREGEGGGRVLWLGDSTAAGVGATTADQALPAIVDRALGDGESELVVRAVSGATAADVLADQLGGLEGRFDRIYISVGANDVTALTSKASFRQTYEAMLDALPPADEVVLLGVPDMGAPLRLPQPLRAIAGWRGEQLNAVIESVASERRHQYVDIAAETGPEFRTHPVRYLAADNFHPSDEGYGLWRDAVVESVTR